MCGNKKRVTSYVRIPCWRVNYILENCLVTLIKLLFLETSYNWCYFLNLHKFADNHVNHVPIDMFAGLLSKHFEKLSDEGAI